MGSGYQIGNLLRFWFYHPLIALLVTEALVVPRYRSEGVWDMCWFLGGEVWLVDVGRNWRQPSLMLGLRVMWDNRYRMIHYMDLYCIVYTPQKGSYLAGIPSPEVAGWIDLRHVASDFQWSGTELKLRVLLERFILQTSNRIGVGRGSTSNDCNDHYKAVLHISATCWRMI